MTPDEFEKIYLEELAKRELWEKQHPGMFEQARRYQTQQQRKEIYVPHHILLAPHQDESARRV